MVANRTVNVTADLDDNIRVDIDQNLTVTLSLKSNPALYMEIDVDNFGVLLGLHARMRRAMLVIDDDDAELD